MKCMFCSHDVDEHEPVGETEDGKRLFECVVKGCRCEVVEDDL